MQNSGWLATIRALFTMSHTFLNAMTMKAMKTLQEYIIIIELIKANGALIAEKENITEVD